MEEPADCITNLDVTAEECVGGWRMTTWIARMLKEDARRHKKDDQRGCMHVE
jgi:hypothetical protein